MKYFRKKSGKSIVVSKIMLIFATSKLKCGAEAAGSTSSPFCIHELINYGIATPSRESGQRPGVTALEYLTARSVVFFLSKLKCYVKVQLFLSGERDGSAVFLPASGIEKVQPVDEHAGTDALRVDRGQPGTSLGDQQSDGNGGRVAPLYGRRYQRDARRHRAPSRGGVHAAARRCERLYPREALRPSSAAAAAHHRLSRCREYQVAPLFFKAVGSPFFQEAFQHFLHPYAKSVRKPSDKFFIG